MLARHEQRKGHKLFFDGELLGFAEPRYDQNVLFDWLLVYNDDEGLDTQSGSPSRQLYIKIEI